MSFACQRDSYLKEFTTNVTSCKPAEAQISVNGKKSKVSGFEILLENTILFPEGGGQPDDRGMINDVEVLKISRRAADAVHFVTTEIPVDTEVHLKVDWTRRFDHMQQHSGQHLISGLAELMYGYKTTTWLLGEKVCFIELDTPDMPTEQVSSLEEALNQNIRDNIEVIPQLFENKDDPELKHVRCRGLPEDHVGPVRVLTIKGIDSTMCCGTHVKSLSDIQMIKLMYVTKSKTKNRVYLYFVAGNRILSYLTQSCDVERQLTSLLKGPQEQHVELAEKAVKGFKAEQKVTQNLLRDVAILEGQKYKQKSERDPVFVLHRKEGDNEFMNLVIGEIGDENTTCFLSVGDEKGAGLFILAGKEKTVTTMGPKVAEVLDGKGAINRGRYRGKANKMAAREQAIQLLLDFVQNNSES